MFKKILSSATHSAVNIALRGATLASKFILIIYLAKVLDPEQLGIYGLFTVSINYALYLCGLDFYTYSQREMLSLSRMDWGRIIRHQFIFYGLLYFIIMPLLLFIFVSDLLPWQVIGWFYIILTFEHLSQELYRLLVVCDRITLAHIILFFRGGAWVFVVVALFWIKPEMHGLTVIWIGWSVGVAISILIAMFGVHKVIGPMYWRGPIDWIWIRRGIKVAAQYLIGTLSLRGLFTFDRYILDIHFGKSAVGVYSLFMSLVNSLQAFADAGVVSKLYPRIVVAYRTGCYKEFRHHLKNMTVGIALLYICFSAGLYLTIKPVFVLIGRQVYIGQVAILWVLLVACGIYCLGLVPHYALYAIGADRSIVISSIISLIVFMLSAITLIYKTKAMIGVAIAVLVGVSCLSVMKLLIYIKHNYYKQLSDME